jgi:hypothetical protein
VEGCRLRVLVRILMMVFEDWLDFWGCVRWWRCQGRKEM